MKYLLFGATWCPPCTHMKKLLEELKWEVQDIDIDKQKTSVDRYKVKKIPTIIKIDSKGNEINRYFGIKQTAKELEEAFQ